MSKDITVTLPLGPRGGGRTMRLDEAVQLLFDRIKYLEDRLQQLEGWP